MNSAKLIQLFRRSMLLLSGIILISALGCGPAATPIIFELPTATPRPDQPTSAPATPFLPTGIPTITTTPFEPTATIKIFSHAPLSGDQAEFGTDILRGTELAVRQLGLILQDAYGFKVELVSYDDQNQTTTAVVNAQAIVADPEILCGVGHYDSNITISASNVYHLAGLAMVAPGTTAPLLTDRGYREVNRVIGRADGQGIAAAQFAISRQMTSVYIISQQDESSLLNAEYFRRDSGNLGIQLLGMRVGNVTNENINQIVTQVVTANPDMVYLSSAAEQGAPLLAELRAAGYMGMFLGTEDLENPELISLAGPSLLEGGGLFYTAMSPAAEYFSEAAQFIWDYQTAYGSDPLDLAARAYDAAGICLRGIEVATETLGGVAPSRAEVARAIRRLNNYKGITGTYDFNRQGDPDPAAYYVYQVTSVDPASWSQNPIVTSYEIIPP